MGGRAEEAGVRSGESGGWAEGWESEGGGRVWRVYIYRGSWRFLGNTIFYFLFF